MAVYLGHEKPCPSIDTQGIQIWICQLVVAERKIICGGRKPAYDGPNQARGPPVEGAAKKIWRRLSH